MLMPNGQIMRYSNVDWIGYFPAQNRPTSETAKQCYITKSNFNNGLFDSFKKLKNPVTLEDIVIPIDFSTPQQHNTPIPPEPSITSSPLSSSPSSPPPFDLESNTRQPSTVLPAEQLLTRG